MCTNRKEIITKSGRRMYVNCGHCDACQQQKANANTFKIRSEAADRQGYVSLFITLTYQNKYIPYIRKSDYALYNGDVFPIYRDYNVRRVRCVPFRHHKRQPYRYVSDVKSAFYDYKDYHESCGCLNYVVPSNADYIDYMSTLRYQRRDGIFYHSDDKVGVIYYKDLQDFFKRLRVNYKRLYHEDSSFNFFGVAEYGPKTKRPHFHVLLDIPASKITQYIEAIVKSWRYSSEKRLRRYIEIAKDCSSYVSSYVNTYTSLSPIYREKEIAPKCTHSKHYGFNRVAFDLSQVEKMLDNHDFSFTYNITTKTSSHDVCRLLPRYVLSYWFPKIQGFSSLDTDALIDVYTNPSHLSRYAKRLKYDTNERIDILDEYNDHKIGVRHESFYNRFSRYLDDFQTDKEFYEKEKKIIKRSTLHRNIVILRSARHRYYMYHTRYIKAVDISDSDLYKLYFEAQKLAADDSRYIDVMLTLDNWIKERETIYDSFAQCVVRAWTVYSSNLLKQMYDIPIQSRYENIYLFYESKSPTYPLRGKARFPSMPYVDYEVDVNENSYNKVMNLRLTDKFSRYDKAKKVNNSIYSQYTYDL